MIRAIERDEIEKCVEIIQKSFLTVAKEHGFTKENAPRFTALTTAAEKGCKKMNIGIVEENTKIRKWYEKLGAKHIGTKKFDFFPFTCGYMEKDILI